MPKKSRKRIGRKYKAPAKSGKERPIQNVKTKKDRKRSYNRTHRDVKKEKAPEEMDSETGMDLEQQIGENAEDEIISPTKSELRKEIKALRKRVEEMENLKKRFDFKEKENETNIEKYEREKEKREKERALHESELCRAICELEEGERDLEELKEKFE